jgi:hypothetical protein
MPDASHDDFVHGPCRFPLDRDSQSDAVGCGLRRPSALILHRRGHRRIVIITDSESAAASRSEVLLRTRPCPCLVTCQPASENLIGDIPPAHREKADRMSSVKLPRRPHPSVPPTCHSSLTHSAAPKDGAAHAATAAADAVPPPRRVLAAAGTRSHGEHGHAGPPARTREAARQHAPA